MKIGVFVEGGAALSARTVKMVGALAEAEHDVTLFTWRAPACEGLYRNERVRVVALDMILVYAHWTPLWNRRSERARSTFQHALQFEKLHAAIVRGVALGATVLPWLRRAGIRSTLDLAGEAVPSAPWLPCDSRLATALANAQTVLVADDATRVALVERAVSATRVVLVRDTPVRNVIASHSLHPFIRPEGAMLLALVPPTARIADVEPIVRAHALARSQGSEAALVLATTARIFDALAPLRARLGVGSSLVHLPLPEALSAIGPLIACSDAVVLSAARGDGTDVTALRWLYDAMAAGRATVVSSDWCGRTLVERENAGLVHRGGDAHALAGAMRTVLDPARRPSWEARAAAASRERYHWGADARRLQSVFVPDASRTPAAGHGTQSEPVAAAVRPEASAPAGLATRATRPTTTTASPVPVVPAIPAVVTRAPAEPGAVAPERVVVTGALS